jgi:hypothetical protein
MPLISERDAFRSGLVASLFFSGQIIWGTNGLTRFCKAYLGEEDGTGKRQTEIASVERSDRLQSGQS